MAQEYGQPQAILRVCARCEWIYRRPKNRFMGCPRCGFASYGARSVFGNKAYVYEKTQKPWYEKKMIQYMWKLQEEISQSPLPACGNIGKYVLSDRSRCVFGPNGICIYCGIGNSDPNLVVFPKRMCPECGHENPCLNTPEDKPPTCDSCGGDFNDSSKRNPAILATKKNW